MADHWSGEGLPTWEVKVGERVRQGVDPAAAEAGAQQAPPVGTLGTVTWVDDPPGGKVDRREVWVRWDGVRYADHDESNMSSWIEPA
jgi:hypothetical protein